MQWIHSSNLQTIRSDLTAGFTGAIIVLPQGIAFATIAGLPPQYGLYTAMVTPIVAALFGSSHHLVSGPTTAISIVIFSAVSHHVEPGSPEFISLALTLTFLAGVYQLSFGLARLGNIINFVSHTVVIGFTAGAAILIATSQMKHVLGIFIPKDESFLHIWANLFNQYSEINLIVLLVAMSTLAAAVLVKILLPKLPNLLIGMLAGGLVGMFLGGEAVGIKFVGEIPAHLPPLSAPDFSLETIKNLAPEAFAIALLGLIEAVSISRAIAVKTNQQINSSQEFIGQGLSNVVGSFFSSYAGSGSFTRSGLNYSSGARSPMSAIFSALFLMVIVLFVAPLTAYLPIASMSGVILIVAYNLIDFKHIKHVLKFSKEETSILLTTFFATLFLELEFAIYLGVLLSLVLFLKRTSTPKIATLSVDINQTTGKRKFIDLQTKAVKRCPQLKIIRIDMSVYFGSINYIQRQIQKIYKHEKINHVLVVSSGINFIDLSGAEALITENNQLMLRGGGLYFCGLKLSVSEFAVKTGFVSRIGEDHFFVSKKIAIEEIYKRLNYKKCLTCQARVFDECGEVV
ncbi:MAG: SulP family inorganic anion transporter [Gammaproteobacteria bacterium]